MARLVKIESDSPYKLETLKGKVWICQCGLSKNKPFCDGSHTRTVGEKNDLTYTYSSLTQKRNDLSVSHSGVNEIIYKFGDLQIIKLDYQDCKYEIVQEIRQSANVETKDLIDQWSDIYLLKKNEVYCATMRVTQARDGQLDVEDYYHEFLKDTELRPLIGSAGKLCKRNEEVCSTKDIFLFIIEVWKDQYKDGMRYDLINATFKMARYYERLGYKRVGDQFIHPVTKKKSIALLYKADISNECLLTNRLMSFYIN